MRKQLLGTCPAQRMGPEETFPARSTFAVQAPESTYVLLHLARPPFRMSGSPIRAAGLLGVGGTSMIAQTLL